MKNEESYDIESYGDGFIIADYSGNRGKFGAAYFDTSGLWHDQPTALWPFRTKEAAESELKKIKNCES